MTTNGQGLCCRSERKKKIVGAFQSVIATCFAKVNAKRMQTKLQFGPWQVPSLRGDQNIVLGRGGKAGEGKNIPH